MCLIRFEAELCRKADLDSWEPQFYIRSVYNIKCNITWATKEQHTSDKILFGTVIFAILYWEKKLILLFWKVQDVSTKICVTEIKFTVVIRAWIMLFWNCWMMQWINKSNFCQMYIRHKFGIKQVPNEKWENFEGNHTFVDLSREICTFPFLPGGNLKKCKSVYTHGT